MQQPPLQPPFEQHVQQQPNYQSYPPQFNTAPVMSVGSWIVTFLLMMIPLVNLILMIVWAASSSENPNRKNWAIASLLMMVINFVIVLLMWSAIAGILAGIINS